MNQTTKTQIDTRDIVLAITFIVWFVSFLGFLIMVVLDVMGASPV